MGYNKIILCCNDGDHAVEKDTRGWWRACQEAFGKMWGMSKGPVSFSHRNHIGYWEAVYQGHADQTAVIIVGGNTASVVDVFGGASTNYHGDEEVQIQILKDILHRKGYVVYKKPLAGQRKKYESHNQS